MKLVEKHIISKNHKFYQEIDRLAFLSKNLYNAGLWTIQQHYQETGKYLGFFDLRTQFVRENQNDYRALPAEVSGQILRLLDKNFKSFFAGLKSYKKNPEKFLKCPQSPKFKKKLIGRNILIYNTLCISQVALREGFVKLSMCNIKFKTEKQNIKQVRIVPKAGHYVIEVVYDFEKETCELNENLYAGIDIGLNNLATVTSNKAGFVPFIINGKPLKSINQYYNKKKAEFQSFLTGHQRSSKKIQGLSLKRNCKIDDYLHKASKQIVVELVNHKIANLVIGKNKEWKQEINLGKKTNQNFVSIPHQKFVQLLTYKCELEGIKVILTEESYTSKCSFLDNESMEKKEVYAGRRIKRGLFRSANKKLINADVNGSLNIIRKVVPNAFGNGIEGVSVHPYRYNAIK